MSRNTACFALVTGTLVAFSNPFSSPPMTKLQGGVVLTPVLELAENEGVFSYSRISPDGRLLAYASERASLQSPEDREIMAVVADLETGRVLFAEPGVDPYFSVRGDRVIFMSYAGGRRSTSIWSIPSGAVDRDVAPLRLGEYYSWGSKSGHDVILTIAGNYYSLDGNKSVPPYHSVPDCAEIGRGERPLLSKDAEWVTAFVRGELIVRRLNACTDIFKTRVRGGKADFSYDGRYIAFHSLKPSKDGYQIQVIDLQRRTIRTVVNLAGSSHFPSWTRDGRLLFRHDGQAYKGFMFASNVLAALEQPLPNAESEENAPINWEALFPESERPRAQFVIATIWSAWSAHSGEALIAANEAVRTMTSSSQSVIAVSAVDPATSSAAARSFLRRFAIRSELLPLANERFQFTDADNQIPAVLLFRHGKLVDRKLGAQTARQLTSWVLSAASSRR